MYLGDIVETAPSTALYSNPLHPYTEALLSAVPKTNPDLEKSRILLEGDVPSPANPPSGCKFHPRCRYAQPICSQEHPDLVEMKPDHYVACHLARQLNLAGISEMAT